MHYTTSCYTQFSAPEDGRNQRSKRVELIGIINKPLLLHLVGVYILCINYARSNKYQIHRSNFVKMPKISNFMYVCLVEADLLQADRYDEANNRFLQSW